MRYNISMKKSFIFTTISIVAVSSLFLASCSHSEDSSDVSAGGTNQPSGTAGTLKLGTILPESGSISFLGPPMTNSVALAVKEINAADLGIQIDLSTADSGTDQAIASNAASTHIAAGVDAVIGAAASSVSLSILDKLSREGIILFSPSATSPSLTTAEDRGLFFRTAPSDILQGRLLADLIIADNNQSTVILNRADDYGRQLALQTKESLEAAGGSGTLIEYDPEAATYEAEAQKALATNADSVVVIAFEEGVKVLIALINNGFGPSDVPTYITDGVAVNDLGERVDPNNHSVVATVKGVAPSAAPASGEPTFVSRLQAFAPSVTDLIFAGSSYDAVVVLALAALQAGSTDTADFAPRINDITRGGTKCTLFVECANLIKAGTDIDYDGAAGILEFSDVGEPSAGAYDVFLFDAEGVRVKTDEVDLTIN